MERRRCIFCGAHPTTREHIISRWIYDVIAQDPRGLPERGEQRRFSSDGGDRSWQTSKPNLVANCVCEGCNSGWMSAIEVSAKPMLSAMIKGEPTTLEPRAREEVAAWLGLKAIVERYSNSPIHPVEPEWIEYYREHRRPPAEWNIRISRYLGAHPVRTYSGSITVRFRQNSSPSIIQESGLLFSVAIGQFWGQVLGTVHEMTIGDGRRRFAQIWPERPQRLPTSGGTPSALVAWPPEGWLDDSDFERYAVNATGEAPQCEKS